MSKSRLRNTILAFLLCILGIQTTYATHLIGGEMNYKCLGNNEYQISLTVYRDCFLGEAPLDDTAYVAVFDAFGDLRQTLPILIQDIDTIFQSDECFIVPPNICVETTTYIDTITLTPQPGGYQIAYQRCCRNGTILNIVDPLNTGTTYSITISETAMLYCNSSPILSGWPPTFVCVNRPLTYQNSAVDLDGDSLVYRLCTPLDGGISVDLPRPRPSLPPPFDSVIWNTPTYNLNNLLGGVPLEIDAKTGLLTAIPNTIGQFVVGICVDEYRDGQLLSTTLRDFQYNVIPCEAVSAQFELPTELCEDLPIQPVNLSTEESSSFLWKLIDPNNNLLAISNEENPSFNVIDTGQYTVRLIVKPESVCSDSMDQNIYVQLNSLIADFQYDVVGCLDTVALQFTDRSRENLGGIDAWNWTITGEIDQFSSNEQNPLFFITNSQELTARLEISTLTGCRAEKEIDLTASIIPDSFSISTYDTLVACLGDSVELNPIFNPELMYVWSPASGLSSTTSPNPKAFPDSSMAYVVMIQDSGANCTLLKNVFLEVIDFDNAFDFTINTLECGDSIRLQLVPIESYDLSNVNLVWEVRNQNQLMVFDALEPVIVIRNEDPIIVRATVSDEFGCSVTVEKNTAFDLLEVDIPAQHRICFGDSVSLNPNFNPLYQYTWSPASIFIDPTLPNPTISPASDVSIMVTIQDPQSDCSIEQTVVIELLPSIESANFDYRINHCQDSIVLEITELNTTPIGALHAVQWNLNGGIEQFSSTDLLPTFTLENSQSIELSALLNSTTSCPLTIATSFRVGLLEELALVSPIVLCQGESVALNPASLFPQYIYNWSSDEPINDSNSVNPILTPNQSTTVQVLYSDSTQLCQVEDFIEVIVRDTLPKLSATVEIDCDGRTVTIIPNSEARIAYDFGDNTEILDTTASQVRHQYEVAGDFEITLKFVDNQICPDSTTVIISLPEENLSPVFDWNVEACENNLAALELINLTKPFHGQITQVEWTLSSGQTSNDPEPVFELSNLDSITAFLSVTLSNNPTCQDSTSLRIPPLVVGAALPDTLIACQGESIELNPNFGLFPLNDFTWSPNVGSDAVNIPNPTVEITDTSIYTVVIANEFECFLQDTILAQPAPTIEISAIDIPVICDTMDIVLSAESPQVNQLIWLNESGDTLGLESNTTVNIDQSQSFTVVGIDAHNCTASQTIFADFQPISLAFEQDQSVCENEMITLFIENLRPDNNLVFNWTPSEEIIANANTINPTVAPNNATSFSFTVTNEAGCESEGIIFVDVHAPPEINANANPTTIFQGEASQLSTEDNPGFIYEWLPNDNLNNSTIATPIARPTSTTDYILNVVDENGCRATTSVTINVQEGICDFPYIFVPSGFTPNGDGQNDLLFVRGNFIDELTFAIYNRWGDKVFETDDQDIGWDGTFNGNELPSGVFGYYLRAVCKDGQVHTTQGNVTLIR